VMPPTHAAFGTITAVCVSMSCSLAIRMLSSTGSHLALKTTATCLRTPITFSGRWQEGQPGFSLAATPTGFIYQPSGCDAPPFSCVATPGSRVLNSHNPESGCIIHLSPRVAVKLHRRVCQGRDYIMNFGTYPPRLGFRSRNRSALLNSGFSSVFICGCNSLC
jgi:hypothetical protein